MKSLIGELKCIDTFAELSEDDLRALAEICHIANYPARSVIAREGFDAESIFCPYGGYRRYLGGLWQR